MDEDVVFLASETLHSDEVIEIDELNVYASAHGVTNRGLTTSLRAH